MASPVHSRENWNHQSVFCLFDRENDFLKKKKKNKNNLKASRRFLAKQKQMATILFCAGKTLISRILCTCFVFHCSRSGKEKGVREKRVRSCWKSSLKVKTSSDGQAPRENEKRFGRLFLFAFLSHCQGRIGHGES